METILLNDTEVCNRCGPGICDNCIEHEIDLVYGERGDPWADDDDIYLQDCAICHTQYNITDPGASVHYCSECQKVFDTERREWIKRFGNI